MMENQSSDDMQDAGQYPHTPGQNPQGSGEPRHLNTPDAGAAAADAGTGAGAGAADAEGGADAGAGSDAGADTDAGAAGADAAPSADGGAAADAASADQGSPLGGDETTEEQLEADTAVERDALKMLDPDDTPA